MHETVLGVRKGLPYFTYHPRPIMLIYIGTYVSELNGSYPNIPQLCGCVIPVVRPMHLRSEQAWGLESWTMGIGVMK